MTTAQQMRQWAGPALFSYGFRPFFLFGALWAALAMLLWIMMLTGWANLPMRLDAVSWHAHEFLFGYLGAVVAGFLLTAVPNWTGRLPVVGWRLAGLFALWGLGRIGIAFSALIPAPLPELLDLLFPILLAGLILREIIAGKNWRNLGVLVLLTLFIVANLTFHIEASSGANAARGFGLRLGVGSVLMMISLIGGRIIPSFSRNWMVTAGKKDLPVPPMQRFDKVTLMLSVVGLILWVVWPQSPQAAAAMSVIGVLHLLRLWRWKGHHTMPEPLVLVLHLGYLFVPLGALATGLAIMQPALLASGTAQHLWMAGAFALMSLGVMTRATLGHTGQEVKAGTGSLALFLCVLGSVICRISAGFWPDAASVFYVLAGLFWSAAFAGFVLLYGRLLLGVRASMPRP
ncbi:MAG: hypothetical protein ACJAVM_001029 [Sulfitobacter sp.]|jgi:uncharacterized protein involved in response to NO